MGVGRVVQAKVTAIFRLVHRLLHRSQQCKLEHTPVFPAAQRKSGGSIVPGARQCVSAKRDPEAREENTQGFDPLSIWRVMHPIQSGGPLARNKLCGTHVGAQHAFFNQPVRIVAINRHDIGYCASLIEDEPDLLPVKVHRAPSPARGKQHLVQIVKRTHRRSQRITSTIQDFLYTGIGKTPVRADHRVVKAIGAHCTAATNCHLTHNRQPINTLFQ